MEENNNMKLWKSVCTTDPKNTKAFRGKGGFSGTTIVAHSQRQKGTELWGPFGGKWGIKDELYEIITLSDDPHDTILSYHGILYYPDGEFGIHSDTDVWMYVSKGKYWTKTNDIFKKVRTDAFTKGLSELGFNADVFHGLFDDNKYIEHLREQNRPPAITKEQTLEIEELKTGLNPKGDTEYEIKFTNQLQKQFKKAAIDRLDTEQAKVLIAKLKARVEFIEGGKKKAEK